MQSDPYSNAAQEDLVHRRTSKAKADLQGNAPCGGTDQRSKEDTKTKMKDKKETKKDKNAEKKDKKAEKKDRKEEKKDKKDKKTKHSKANNDNAAATEEDDDQGEEEMDLFVRSMVAEGTMDSPDQKFFFKVQHKLQAKRNSIAILLSREGSTGKWVQRCQLVVKDGLPPWAAMVIMKHVMSELALGTLSFETVKARRDELVQNLYQGTYAQLVFQLERKFEETSSNEMMLKPDADIVRRILEHNSSLPVKQLTPEGFSELQRARPLDEGSTHDEPEPPNAAAKLLPAVPPGRHADTCETLVEGNL